MGQILGLYIGIESIGWSLIRESSTPSILSIGTRVFSSFVTHLGEGDRETSKTTHRAQIRNARKMYLRKTYRKKRVLLFLADNALCPLSVKELNKWNNDTKKTSRGEQMDAWFSLNPYKLRAKGVHEQLSKHELGRVVYHMTQRRGKTMTNDIDTSKAKTLLKGLPTANRLGIQHARVELKNQFLGEYLNELLPKQNEPYNYQTTRVRNRYLDRKMYFDELEAIFTKQKEYHKLVIEKCIETLFGDDDRLGLLFYQRPARYKKQRGSSTLCPFIDDKKTMWLSHPLHEWYVVYCWLDSIRLYGKKLDAQQREKALKIALQFAGFLFKKVRIALDIDDPLAFNYEDSTKIYLANTLVNLCRKTAFGNTILNFSNEKQHELWHDLHFYNDKALLKKRLKSKWGLAEKKAAIVAAIRLKPGRGKLSMKAAKIMLPLLKKGYSSKHAIFFGGVINAIGQDQWDILEIGKKSNIESFVRNLIEDNKISNPKWISNFQSVFDIRLNTQKLFLTQQHIQEDLLSVSSIDNQEIFRKYKPVAQKSIFELRKLVNQLTAQYGAIDKIKFVLTNEIKVNAQQRKTLYIAKKVREQELPLIHDAVLAEGQNPTHTNLMKYKLWLEWNKTCPYTGTVISLYKLFSDDVSIVYVHPWKRFFNDADKNKALCMSFFKENIEDKTPFEYFTKQPSGVWENVKTRVLDQLLNGSAKHAPYQKFRHFVLSSYVLNKVEQEFNDQHNMAFKTKNLLSRICPDVTAMRGSTISNLRRKWGIASPDSQHKTSRRNYNSREPALNATVTALNSKEYLEQLRFWNRYEPQARTEVFPTPWTQFTRDVLNMYDSISVSIETDNRPVRRMTHKKSMTLSLSPKGKLHKDSYYGKRVATDGIESFHIKKSMDSLKTAKQVSKIVDYSIRELVYDQIDLCGGFSNGKVPKNSLTEPTKTGWETKVFLPNKRGDQVPVRKVRLRENVGNAVQLVDNENKYVNPRNNHHVMIYKTLDNEYQEDIVSFWEAVRRIRNKEPLYQLPSDGRVTVTTLHSNDCFIMGLSQTEIVKKLKTGESLWQHVYRVQRLSSKYYEFRHIYDLGIYDQTYPNYIRILHFGDRKTGWKTHNPFKVNISLLGKITSYYKLLKVPEMQ